MAQTCCYFKKINLLVYLLVICFGVASWVDINGLWVELPILVQRLPEKWDLASYMVIIIQIANIGPLLFTILSHLRPTKVPERPIIYLIIGTGAVACLLLAFFWSRTSVIAGQEHSTALLVLQFFLAMVDCTSSVAFLPFMANFKTQYMTAYFIGEGFSGLLPSLVALGQGVGQMKCVNHTIFKNETLKNGTVVNETIYQSYPQYMDPRFSIEIFFFFLFGMLILCGVAFTLLNFLPLCKLEQVHPHQQLGEDSHENLTPSKHKGFELSGNEPGDNFLDAADAAHSSSALISSRSRKPGISIQKDSQLVRVSSEKVPMTSAHYFYLLVLTAAINAMTNGILPSIQPYSCLPYGMEPFHLAVTLSSIANPLACITAFFFQASSTSVISVLTFLGLGIGGYIIGLAALSPAPPLVGLTIGAVLSVAAWVLGTLLLVYSKVSIAALFRLQGKKALLWCGAVTQVGSAIGAIVMFLIVNVGHFFTQANVCS